MRLTLRCDPPYESATLRDAAGATLQTWSSPLDALHWLGTEARSDEWIGWINYDLGRWSEKLPSVATDDLNLPLFVFTAHDGNTSQSPPLQLRGSLPDAEIMRSTFTRDEYERAVQRVIDYIGAGDVFQVNLSQRFTVPLNIDPSTVYE